MFEAQPWICWGDGPVERFARMETTRFAAWLVFLVSSSILFLAAAPVTEPVITRISVLPGQVIVEVAVPAGFKKITLESRERLGAGTWIPRAVLRTDGSGGVFTFELVASAQVELLRVRSDPEDLAPASFFSGETEFSSAGEGGFDLPPGNGPAMPGQEPAPDEDGENREVVESDIWRLKGDTL
jgi:hypothetical protein